MTPELLTKQCGQCGAWLHSHDGNGKATEGSDGSAWIEGTGIAIFRNHTSANAAARAAGWMVQSESIGGDMCPRCVGREEVAPIQGDAINLNAWQRALEAYAKEARDLQAEVKRLKYAGMAEAHEAQAADEFKRERDEARAEVERLEAVTRGNFSIWANLSQKATLLERERDESNAELKRIFEHLPERHLYAVRDCPPGQGTSHAVALCVDELCDVIDERRTFQKERDEARAETDHQVRKNCELAHALLTACNERYEARAEAERWRDYTLEVIDTITRIPSTCELLPWDTNDDADELAAYAEASDLRALAEREQLLSLEQFEADEAARKYLDGEGGGDE